VTTLDDLTEAEETTANPAVVLAEKAVLAAMITSRTAAEELAGMLTEDCFAGSRHRVVYCAARNLAEEGLPLDPATVLDRIIATEQGVWRTGTAGLIIADLLPHAGGSWRWHAAILQREAKRNRLAAASVSLRQMAFEPGFDAEASGDLIRKMIDDALAGPTVGPGDVVTAADLFMSTIERLESPDPPGLIQFPWAELRRLVRYLRPGQLVTVAARPSLGKSLVAQDLARYTGLRRQIPCALFTLEQDRDEVMDRLLAAEAGVLLEHITGKELTDADWDRIAAARDRFEESSLVIDDAPKITIPHIRARLRGLTRREPVKLAIVDYLQLMDGGPEAENRQREVAALVGNLKGIAREFRIPVVMCCQLNRGPEHRQDKRPHMSDARETGSVENDSDVAILIHREDFYDAESPRAGEADLIVDKNRNGPRGTATIRFQGHYARFVDPEWSPSSAIGAQA